MFVEIRSGCVVATAALVAMAWVGVVPAVAAADEAAKGVADAAVSSEAPRSPWAFDGNLGLPAFGAGETSLAFDVSAGYDAGSMGADANVASSSYSLSSSDGASSTSRFTLAANAWYLTGTPLTERWEGRAELQSVSYAGMDVGAESASSSSTSLMRLVAFGGYHAPKGGTTSWRVAAGIGIQNEMDVQVTDESAGATSAWGTRFVLRGGLQRPLVEDAARLRAETELATLSMSKLSVGSSASLEDVFGVESTTRLHADVDALAFAGFVPDAFVGLDVVAVGSAAAFVPVFGVGLVH